MTTLSVLLVLLAATATKTDQISMIVTNCAMLSEVPTIQIMKYFGQTDESGLKIEDISSEGKTFLACLYRDLGFVNKEDKFDIEKFASVIKEVAAEEEDAADLDFSSIPAMDVTLRTDDDIAKFHVKLYSMLTST